MSSSNDETEVDVIKIGSFEESHYLLKGVAYLDQLLLGYELVDCPVLFITLESWTDVISHWEEQDGTIPWAIHPQIVERLRQEVEQREYEQQREAQKEALAELDDDDDGWLDNLKG